MTGIVREAAGTSLTDVGFVAMGDLIFGISENRVVPLKESGWSFNFG